MSAAEKTLEELLAEARAQAAELDRQREEATAKAAAQRELEAVRRSIADKKALLEAEQKHGPSLVYGAEAAEGRKLIVVSTDLGDVLLKRPNHVIWKRFQDTQSTDSNEVEKLVRHCLVHPDAPTFDRMLEEQPGILMRAAGACAVLAGVRMKEAAGKS